jgi:hypothetical protein
MCIPMLTMLTAARRRRGASYIFHVEYRSNFVPSGSKSDLAEPPAALYSHRGFLDTSYWGDHVAAYGHLTLSARI